MAKVDLSFLSAFTRGDNAKMKKYIGMFLESAPEQLGLMEKYCEEKNWHLLKVTAHSLKPQMNYMGIAELEHTIKDIEFFAGAETKLEELPEKIAFCKAGCYKAMDLLKNELSKL